MEPVDVRFCGIYALQRIADDSSRDAPTIVQVLCAFIRGHGRGPDDDGTGSAGGTDMTAT
jgi:hypothetical protein